MYPPSDFRCLRFNLSGRLDLPVPPALALFLRQIKSAQRMLRTEKRKLPLLRHKFT